MKSSGMSRAQVSIEYLLLLSFVIVISFIVAISIQVLYHTANLARKDVLDTRDDIITSIFS